MSRFFVGFKHAYHGLSRLMGEEPHFRFQAIVALFLIGVIIFMPLTYAEAGFILVAIVLVLGSEALNTIMERIADAVGHERRKKIGAIKDMSAAVVMIYSIGALGIGMITALHYMMRIWHAGSLVDLDRMLSLGLNSWAGYSDLGDRAIVFFASTSAFLIIAVFAVFLFLSRINRRDKIYYALCASAAAFFARFGVTECIRVLYPRLRPFMVMSLHQLIPEQGSSFPSGHAAFFFALFMVVFSMNKKLGWWFFAASVIMGIARVMSGVHYVSDIVGGMIVGVVMGWVVVRLMARYRFF